MKSSPSQGQTILLIDDNRDGLLVRRALLEEAGYHVTAATNGEEGLKLFEASAFDLVVTDYRMPKMDGLQLIQKIRTEKPGTRIVLLSGFVDPLGLTEANTGADVVLPKGASEAVALVRSVKRLLNAPCASLPRVTAVHRLSVRIHGKIWDTGVVGGKVTRVIFAGVLWSLATAATPPTVSPKPAGAAGSGRATNLKVSPAVARWMRAMTLRDEVAQLVFIPFHGESPNPRSREYRKFMRLITQTRVGGLVLNNIANGRVVGKADPYQVAAFLNKLQRLAKIPLLVGADFERGASMRIDGTTMFPHAMAFGAAGDPGLVRFEGEVTAREARALGVHWVYYPVADVNNNPENPIINIRSFGENPDAVATMVQAFIEGAHSNSKNYVLTTAKHFPGHGDTAVDTHLNLATVPADRQRLNRLELVPFRAAIAAGVDSIMTAHVAVPALAPANLPATLSPAILTDLLRTDLGFKGLVVTDALDMGGIANGYASGEACVLALEAGADALLMPADPEAAIRAVVAAVQSGRLKRARIEESVAKLLAAKEKAGLDRNRLVRLDAVHAAIDSPAANEGAQQAADRAVTLVRNRSSLIPLAAPERACYLVMPESRTSLMGQTFTQEVKRRAPTALMATLDPLLPKQQIDDALAALTGCEVYVVAAFTTASATRGTAGLGGELPHAFDTVWARGKPVVVVALGNPYLLRALPGVPAYLTTFSTVRPSEIAAVKALWGEIPIDGRMPVSIPGIAAYGEGIHTAAIRASRKPGQ